MTTSPDKPNVMLKMNSATAYPKHAISIAACEGYNTAAPWALAPSRGYRFVSKAGRCAGRSTQKRPYPGKLPSETSLGREATATVSCF